MLDRLLRSLRLFERAVLVVKTEEATGEPPLDGPVERCALARAVEVAPALPASWVVDAGDEAATDAANFSSHAGVEDRIAVRSQVRTLAEAMRTTTPGVATRAAANRSPASAPR